MAIDDDVLAAAKALARQQKRPLGKVVSDLLRGSLTRPASGPVRNGVPLLQSRGKPAPVTLETVNALRDELP